MTAIRWGLFAGAVLALGACDVIRVPGDGRTPPAPIPEGAPGPVPPDTPVSDPYGDGDPAPEPPVTIPLVDDDPAGDPADTPVDAPSGDPPSDATSDPAGDPVVDAPHPHPEVPPVAPEDTAAPDTPDTDLPVIDPVTPAPEPELLPVAFQYLAPGYLIPGSGTGTFDETIYAPGMTFPVKGAPAFLHSQVWRPGGGMSTGGQCDPSNYAGPWQDNFCETRSRARTSPFCTKDKIHQGQDIRAGTAAGCRQMVAMRPAKPTLYELVAVEDGVIQYIGNYSIRLRGANSGNLYNYLHLNMAALKVKTGDTVTAGQSISYISNDFSGTPTTLHLHFEIKAPIEGEGITYVPPYMSLIDAYERREGGRGEMIEEETVAIASIPVIPEGFEIIE